MDCEIQIIEEGLLQGDSLSLYLQSDAEPENILADVQKAFNMAPSETGLAYRRGRAGLVASYLCATKPGEYQPSNGMNLCFDLTFLYKLYLVNTAHGSMAENPTWEVEILESKTGLTEDLELIQPRTSLEECVSKYCKKSNRED